MGEDIEMKDETAEKSQAEIEKLSYEGLYVHLFCIPEDFSNLNF